MVQGPGGQAKNLKCTLEAMGSHGWSLSRTSYQYLRKINLKAMCPNRAQMAQEEVQGGWGGGGRGAGGGFSPLNKIPK